MSRFCQPTYGNVGRNQPVMSVKNLQRKLNRQERARREKEGRKPKQSKAAP